MHNLTSWLHYIKTLHAKEIDLGLQRIRQVAQDLQVLTLPAYKIVVAGTNGKGSCVAILAAIYRAAGLRVGAFMSPQLLRFNDQIQIQGVEVTDAALCEAFAAIEQARATISLTYFEWTTLAALWLFKQAALDIIILEVGMGGQDDAVNIIDADTAIITSIAIDHTAFLGHTRAEIAQHKAGILRKQRPIICGDPDPPGVIKNKADALQAPFYQVGIDYHYSIQDRQWQWQHAAQVYSQLPLPQLDISAAAHALMAITVQQDHLPVAINFVEQGLQQAFLAGRFQRLQTEPTVILDVAHNVAACQHLFHKLKQLNLTKSLRIVVAMLKDKDIENSLACFLPEAQHWYVANLPPPRGADASRLSDYLSGQGITEVQVFATVTDAYHTCITDATAGDVVVIFGSFYTVAAILEDFNVNSYLS